MNCFSSLYLLERYTAYSDVLHLCTWWTGLYYYHLEIDVIHVVTTRILKVSGKFAVKESAVAKSSCSDVKIAFQQHLHKLPPPPVVECVA